MFPGMRQRLKVYPCPLEGEAPGVVDQYVAQGAWNCAGEVLLDICYVLFRGWRANSDGRRTSAKLTHRLPKPLTILNEAIEAEGHYLNLWAVSDARERPLQACNGATTGQAFSRSRECLCCSARPSPTTRSLKLLRQFGGRRPRAGNMSLANSSNAPATGLLQWSNE